MCLFQENPFSPVLVRHFLTEGRRYVYSHIRINVFVPGDIFPQFWSGVIVFMLWHHKHKTALIRIWRKPTVHPYVSYEKIN